MYVKKEKEGKKKTFLQLCIFIRKKKEKRKKPARGLHGVLCGEALGVAAGRPGFGSASGLC